MSDCMIKLRMRGASRFTFLTPKGGTNSLRVHAAIYRDLGGKTGEERAQEIIELNRDRLDQFEFKVVKA